MKIIYNSDCKSVPFKKVGVGEIFIDDETAFMKVEHYFEECGCLSDLLAVSLDNGELHEYFEDDLVLIPKSYELNIYS